MSSTQSSSTATALTLLLHEDPLLISHNLTVLPRTTTTSISDSSSTGKQSISTSTSTALYTPNDEAAFSYAASLLADDSTGWMSSSSDVQQRAAEALSEVDRKLALVQGLYERVARESPAAVAGPLLRLHGHSLVAAERRQQQQQQHDYGRASGEDGSNSNSLSSTRDRCDRLRRQGDVLEGVARRVESSLSRGLRRMETATARLSRVLELSSTLKMAMRLSFEAKKIQGSGIDFEAFLGEDGKASRRAAPQNYYAEHSLVDLRDLTRAAASVAAMEELLSHPSLSGDAIAIVEQIRPEAESVATAVRRAAAGLLQDDQTSDSSKLGATLQVYFHLKELPEAVWGAVEDCLASATNAAETFFSPASLQRMVESATNDAKVSVEGKDGKALERELKKMLRDKKTEAAMKWAQGMGDAALKVWNLHRVLKRKSDPVTRKNFGDVFAEARVPDTFKMAMELLSEDDRQQDGGVPSLFALFWNQACIALGTRIQRLLKYDDGRLAKEVAGLYPAVRSAALHVVGGLNDAMRADASAVGGSGTETTTSGGGLVAGIMGGSKGWGDDLFSETDKILGGVSDDINDDAMGVGADSWTRDPLFEDNETANNTPMTPMGGDASSSTTTSSPEWKALCGYEAKNTGLYPLKRAFLDSSLERLTAPLEYLFPEAVTVDEEGVAIPCLPAIPSRYDLAKLDQGTRDELSLADPREGGGELGMTTMISENIVTMVENFCGMVRGATSNAGEDGYLKRNDLTPTEGLKHDQKLIIAMNALSNFLRIAPDKTFVAPYRPAQLPQHEEAAHTAQMALLPALTEIQTLVKTVILTPLCRALNKRLSTTIAKMHQGTYLDDASPTNDESFVETHLVHTFEEIAAKHLAKLPNEYASVVASTVAIYAIYAFVSNASLVRPLGEIGRLRITQDLADLELALEQFVLKGGSTTTLSQLDQGRPYLELRAMRQMLFFPGFEDADATPSDITKTLLREIWMKDVRPSTIFHFLFSFAQPLLSSPHHMKRLSAEEYVGQLVGLDGGVEEGEASAWMVTMACCDAYQQRESVGGVSAELQQKMMAEGDKRVANVLMMVGPELLRRRRQ